MTKNTQRRRQRKANAKAAAAASSAKTAADAEAESARIVPFAPQELVNVSSVKELILIMSDVIAEYQKYHELTGLVHGNINPQNIMRVPLEPDEPDRYGLRVRGVLVDLDHSPLFMPWEKDDGQSSSET